MIIYDITHAYQPFRSPQFVPNWVLENLENIFLPVSESLKAGIVKRHVQLQGATIDAWLNAPDPIKSKAKKFMENLSEAHQKGYIEIGFSAYSHPILPLLSDALIKRQIKTDYRIISKNIGTPSWFWFPEGAVDRKSLQILFQEFPLVTAIIPDGALKRTNFCGFAKTKDDNKIVICNTFLKDVFMNAPDYPVKPEYVPREISWESAKKMAFNTEDLITCLKSFTQNNTIILARDFENAACKYGLFEFKKGRKEIKSFLNTNHSLHFNVMKESEENRETIALEEIQPTAWEPVSDTNNPYPYWNMPSWINFTNAFNEVYSDDLPDETLVTLASDIPWHFLARKEWKPAKNHSREFTNNVIAPIVKKIGNTRLTKSLETLQADMEKR